jgi:type IV pilus assembly protein PilP
MRNLGMKVFSIFLMTVGLGIVFWISTGVIGKAQSQTPDMSQQTGEPPPPDMALPPDIQGGQNMEAPQALPPTEDLPQTLPPDNYQGEVMNPEPEGFSYDPTGLRDPFQPFAPAQPNGPVILTPQVVVSDDPLQNFELSQLRVVGIIWGVKKPKAMVRDPSGKLHMVFKDSKMGRYGGFVAEIREGEIVVVEPTRSPDGLLMGTPRILSLTK